MASPENSTFLANLIRVYFGSLAGFEKYTNLHLGRWRLLHLMQENGVCSPSTLAKTSNVDPAAVTRILRDFERDGVISRTASANDRRQVHVELTRSGRKLVADLLQKRASFLKAALAGLSDEEIDTLQALLVHVQENLKRI